MFDAPRAKPVRPESLGKELRHYFETRRAVEEGGGEVRSE